MMARLASLAASLLMALPIFGADGFFVAEHGDQPNHLGPVRSAVSAYDRRVQSHLIVTPSDLALMIARPSFSGESALAVYEEVTEATLKKHSGIAVIVPNSEKKFYITATHAKESLWYTMPENADGKGKEKVTVTRADIEISAELAIAIQRAWARMLMRTRYPKNSYTGLDGITLEFGVFVRGLGFLRGEIWRPSSGLPQEMMKLGYELIGVAQAKRPLGKAEEAILIEKLRKFERRARE